MSPTAETIGSRRAALANARALLETDPAGAAHQARLVLDADQDCALSHYVLAQALRRLDRSEEAEAAADRAIETGQFEPAVANAIVHMAQRDLPSAEAQLRGHLRENEDDAWALYLMAEIALATGQKDIAAKLANRALKICPAFRHALLLKAALEEATDAQAAMALLDEERFLSSAIGLYAAGIEKNPNVAEGWLVYGNFLRMAGHSDKAVEALRRAIAINPAYGEAWWALADFKTVSFSDRDITTMQSALAASDLALGDREALEFALGRAFELRARSELAFLHYRAGNDISKARHSYNGDAMQGFVDACTEVFTPNYFSTRTGTGCQARDPIFIVGMPRAGSTLLEQILASHSQVEGTSELPDLEQVVAHLELSGANMGEGRYLPKLVDLSANELERMGQGYLWGCRIRRQTVKPRFIDKMPNNWLNVGLILSILPNAKIIDARRHPLACGWSNYRQRFIRGQAFSNDLSSIGEYYCAYTELMDHFDSVLPGRIHRVYHEALLDDFETEARHMLEYCDLPFEPACLEFHRTSRAVRTSSSEQVRQPLNRAGVGQWRQFQPWLAPLVEALGPALPGYPHPA